jgi:16S rRNA (uracil1498-N3)-methyltransferase
VVLEGGAAHYLGRVLRVATGQRVILFNGDGYDYPAETARIGRRDITLRVTDRVPGLAESALTIVVVQALSRGERMDQTLQKCTELGAAAFRLLDTERVEVRFRGDRLDKRMAHWRGVIVSACEQCGRSRVPGLSPPLSLDQWLGKDPGTARLVLDPGSDRSLTHWADGLGTVPAVEIMVGPEGGFSEEELRRIQAAGLERASLGPRILRTETAAAAAVAVLQAMAGDLA